jgi:hypothetical protein
MLIFDAARWDAGFAKDRDGNFFMLTQQQPALLFSYSILEAT